MNYQICGNCAKQYGTPDPGATYSLGKCSECGEYTGTVDSRDIKKDYDLPPGFEQLFNQKR